MALWLEDPHRLHTTNSTTSLHSLGFGFAAVPHALGFGYTTIPHALGFGYTTIPHALGFGFTAIFHAFGFSLATVSVAFFLFSHLNLLSKDSYYTASCFLLFPTNTFR
jgi:hypothetical protein